MSERPKRPGRAATPPPAIVASGSPDVYRFLSVLARVTRRIAEQSNQKRFAQPKERAG